MAHTDPRPHAEGLIKDAFYDARNDGRTMDQAAGDAVQKLDKAGFLTTANDAGPLLVPGRTLRDTLASELDNIISDVARIDLDDTDRTELVKHLTNAATLLPYAPPTEQD